MTNEDKIFYKIGLGILAAAAVYLLLAGITGIHLIRFGAPCIFYQVFGLYCPGCGGTRAVFHLLEGSFLKSFLYHPIVLYGVVISVWFMGGNTIYLLSKQKIKSAVHYRNLYIWILLALLGGNFVIKNLILLVWNIRLL